MGEWSKRVGEEGEKVAEEFLRLVGWGSAQHGVPLPCVRSEVHSKAADGRGTHGIDFLLACNSPLGEGVGQNLVVSVKYSADGYPPSPKGTFRAHFTDLAHTLECFKNSEVRRSAAQGVKGVTRGQDIGVLLWINNDVKGEADAISKVSNCVLPDGLRYGAVYLVDNRRAGFIFDSIYYARQLDPACETTFFYHDTGKSFNPHLKLSDGPLMPVEYINSSVLALKVADKTSPKRVLMLSTLEPFSEAGLKRLMGLSQQLSQGWCSKVILAFRDYSHLEHGNMVQAAKSCFSDARFTGGIEVHSYDRDFRSVAH